jgi:SnoaL-like domain
MTLDDEVALRDKLAIREVIENWAIWRDTGDWEKLRTTWHDDGVMTATWFTGSRDEFIERARTSFSKGNMSSHIPAATAIELRGSRAVAQTRLTLASREMIEGALYDITCIGRFYDLFEKRGGHWAIAARMLTYEKDRADPVFAGETHAFDRALLDRFPQGYRHLAYAQTKKGMTVHPALPGLRGPEVEALYARGKAWLAGAKP